MILVFGILSLVSVAFLCCPLGLPLGIAAWIMGQGDLRKMRENVMDPEGRGLTQAGWICGIIGTILNALVTLGWLFYIGVIAWVASTAKPPPPPPPPRPAPPPTRKFNMLDRPLRLVDYLPGPGGPGGERVPLTRDTATC
jgi:hypothetical protein